MTNKYNTVFFLLLKAVSGRIHSYSLYELLLHIQVKCGVRGDTGPGCNAVGMIDRRVLGIQHLYTHPVYLKTAVRKKRAIDKIWPRCFNVHA